MEAAFKDTQKDDWWGTLLDPGAIIKPPHLIHAILPPYVRPEISSSISISRNGVQATVFCLRLTDSLG
jgi:hypothetical protein